MKNLIKYLLLPLFITSCGEIPKKPVKNIINVENTQADNELDQQNKGKKEYTILVGKLMGQEYVPDILPKGCFENDAICMNVYYLYKINVQHIISGKPLKGIIKAARYQHARYMYRSSENAVFVIERITNKNTIQLLNAEYFVTEYITPKTTYCFSEKLDYYVPEFKESIYSECLTEEEIFGDLKAGLIYDVNQKVEDKLIKQEIFIDSDSEYSDGNNILPEIFDDDDKCNDYIDLDKLDADKNCIGDDIESYRVYIYQVKKGQALHVKEIILDELSKIKINLDDVEMNFQIIEDTDKSILYWHYRTTTKP